MATIEEITLALQTVQNLAGLRDDMRRNAADYKARLARGEDVASVAKVLTDDNTQYRRRIGWVKRVAADLTTGGRTRLANGLLALGIDLTTAESYLTELEAVANRVGASPPSTSAEVGAAADDYLASVAEEERIWRF